jgi:hypothetical protein
MKRRLKQNASDKRRKLLKLKPIELLLKRLPHRPPHRQRPRELLRRKLSKQKLNVSQQKRPRKKQGQNASDKRKKRLKVKLN